MTNKIKKIILSILLIAALGNYARLENTEYVKTVDFLSIFAIGAITALLIHAIFKKESN